MLKLRLSKLLLGMLSPGEPGVDEVGLHTRKDPAELTS